MKKLRFFLIVMLLSSSFTTHAQLSSWLKNKKDALAQKANEKANQRINNTTDKALNKTDSLKISGRKNKQKKAENQAADSSNAANSNAIPTAAIPDSAQQKKE